MKYLITESQLEEFLLRRFTMDELESLRYDYNYSMDVEDFGDSADRDDYVYGLIEDFIDSHGRIEFFQHNNGVYEIREKCHRALLKFLNSN